MAKKATGGRAKLYTLTEVASKTGISMPTLQRYKKLYQERIPSTGEGRKQRYPTSALAVFNQIKKENIGKRGRPRKNPEAAAAPAKKKAAASRRKAKSTRSSAARKATKGTARRRKAAPAKRAAKPKAAKTEGLLTLTEIAKRTKISYPTLSRYVKQHSSKLKSEGVGRARRFYEEAVGVFEQLRGTERPGPQTEGRDRSQASEKSGGSPRPQGRRGAGWRRSASQAGAGSGEGAQGPA